MGVRIKAQGGYFILGLKRWYIPRWLYAWTWHFLFDGTEFRPDKLRVFRVKDD